jgi:hypothetical protein
LTAKVGGSGRQQGWVLLVYHCLVTTGLFGTIKLDIGGINQGFRVLNGQWHHARHTNTDGNAPTDPNEMGQAQVGNVLAQVFAINGSVFALTLNRAQS